MKTLARFFLSLSTAFGVFLMFILLAGTGSVVLVKNLAFFSGVDETPLFQWLAESRDIPKTWWMYLLIFTLGILAVNTVFCTVEGVWKKLGSRNIALRLAPQVMHIGVLLIMLGHLLTASVGFRTDLNVAKGEQRAVSPSLTVVVEDIRVTTDPAGYDTDWETRLTWHEGGVLKGEGILRPVHPLYVGPYGLYLRSAGMEPHPSVLIRVSRDPGALWALLGGVLLAAGGLIFGYGRLRGQA